MIDFRQNSTYRFPISFVDAFQNKNWRGFREKGQIFWRNIGRGRVERFLFERPLSLKIDRFQIWTEIVGSFSSVSFFLDNFYLGGNFYRNFPKAPDVFRTERWKRYSTLKCDAAASQESFRSLQRRIHSEAEKDGGKNLRVFFLRLGEIFLFLPAAKKKFFSGTVRRFVELFRIVKCTTNTNRWLPLTKVQWKIRW